MCIRDSVYSLCMSCYLILGLHINLSEGVSVSSVQAVGSLLSADNIFLGKAGIRIALENDDLNLDEVHLLYICIKTAVCL